MNYDDKIVGFVLENGKTHYSEIRYGNHPNKGGYERCLYIEQGHRVFGDDKFCIRRVLTLDRNTLRVVSYGSEFKFSHAREFSSIAFEQSTFETNDPTLDAMTDLIKDITRRKNNEQRNELEKQKNNEQRNELEKNHEQRNEQRNELEKKNEQRNEKQRN